MTRPRTPGEAMLAANEQMGAIVDAVVGYQAQCIEAGFNETAAEQMAVQYHGFLLTSILTSARSDR